MQTTSVKQIRKYENMFFKMNKKDKLFEYYFYFQGQILHSETLLRITLLHWLCYGLILARDS